MAKIIRLLCCVKNVPDQNQSFAANDTYCGFAKVDGNIKIRTKLIINSKAIHAIPMYEVIVKARLWPEQ
jgi:hypothetical protein